MPCYEPFIKAAGSYCVIKVYRNDSKANELIEFLEESGWIFNGKATQFKPWGFLKTFSRENKEWAQAFCDDPIKHMEMEKRKAEIKKQEDEKKYGKDWSCYSEAELKNRMAIRLKEQDDFHDFLYATNFLNLSPRKEKEIRFLGLKFDEDGCELRFWLSDDRFFHRVELEYIICNNYRIRTKKLYGVFNQGQRVPYTADRDGLIYSMNISAENGLPYEPIGNAELIFGVYNGNKFLYYTKKMILDYDEFEEEFEVTITNDNDFEPEDSRLGFSPSGKSDGAYYEYYSDGDMDASGWEVESYLMKKGYSVAKNKGLSEKERQHILEQVLRSKKMSKWDIIDHIERQINLRKYNSDYDLAVSKWEKDLEFVRKYSS